MSERFQRAGSGSAMDAGEVRERMMAVLTGR